MSRIMVLMIATIIMMKSMMIKMIVMMILLITMMIRQGMLKLLEAYTWKVFRI